MMKKGVPYIVILLLSLLACPAASAQKSTTASTQGRDFWLTFMENIGVPSHYSIIVTAEEGAEVHLTNASGTWSRTVTLAPMSSDSVDVHGEHGEGYHVTSDRNISVFASNYISASYDIATVYPTPTLRSRYMVQCYEEDDLRRTFPQTPGYVYNYETSPEYTVLAVEDSTVVNILTPTGWRRASYFLMAGETVEFIHDPPSGRYINWLSTGTRIEAEGGKPIAVFQGNQCTSVGSSFCDHLFEQAVPLDYWGQEFIVVPLAGRVADDQVKITSSSDMCNVSINGTPTAVLNAGESLLLERRDLYRISTSRPVTACMYFTHDNNTGFGDPSAVLLPPLDQGSQQSTFFAVSTVLSTSRLYANVVVKNCFVQGMTLDGMPVDTAFMAVDSTYSYARLKVTPGTHTLACDYGRFQAVYYGIGIYESYAYVAAMGMQDPDVRLLMNGVEVGDVAYICQGDSVTVELVTGTSFRDTKWMLDGDSVSRNLTLPLHFADTGTHFLRAMLHGDCCYRWCGNVDLTLRVRPKYFTHEADRFCEGTPYPWCDTILLTAGDYIDNLSTVAGCDSVLSLHLEAMKVPLPGIETESDCQSKAYCLTTQHLDTLEWAFLQWSAVPDDTMLHGHEGDSVLFVSPLTTTSYTLRAEVECPADTTVVLTPIVWPIAVLEVEPEKILFSQQTAFDAYDRSLETTGREWVVDGVSLGDVGPQLHYDVAGTEDSVELVLTVTNELCRDTTSAVVQIINKGLYTPNVFTPEESSNNRFVVVASNEIEGELTIYNREGLLVFRTNDLSTGWDGSGSIQGAYVWHLHYRYTHTPKEWHKAVGTVTLLR